MASPSLVKVEAGFHAIRTVGQTRREPKGLPWPAEIQACDTDTITGMRGACFEPAKKPNVCHNLPVKSNAYLWPLHVSRSHMNSSLSKALKPRSMKLEDIIIVRTEAILVVRLYKGLSL